MDSSYSYLSNIPPSIYNSHQSLSNNWSLQLPLQENESSEFYEVQILSDIDDLPLDKSIDDILNLNKYFCHICNIQVPNTYTREHYNSSKHKTCAEIANIALDRTKLQMQQHISTPRKIEIIDTYFCDSCSIVVLISNKEVHESSKAHKISLKHDALLCDLLKIYTDIENVEVESEIDELDLLKQEIDKENLVEDLGSFETQLEKENMIEMNKEIVDAIKTEIHTEWAKKLNHMELETLKIKKMLAKMKTDSILLLEKCAVLTNLVEKSNSNYEKVEGLNKRLDDLSEGHVRVSRNARNKAQKKYQIQKRKERFNRTSIKTVCQSVSPESDIKDYPVEDVTKVNTDEVEENASDIATEEMVDISKTVDETEISNRVKLDIDKKVDEVLAKYFDKKRTVDALNSAKDLTKIKVRKNKKETENFDNEKAKMVASDVSEDGNTELNQENNKNAEKTQDKVAKELKANQIKNENTTAELNPFAQCNENNTKNLPEKCNRTQPIEQTISPEHNNNKNNVQNMNINQVNETCDKNTYTPKKQIKQIKPTENKNAKEKKTEAIIKKNIEEKAGQRGKLKLHTPNFNLVFYLKDISRRCQTEPIHTLEAITDNIIQITAINGDKMRVLLNNFHSFHTKSKDIFCKICESTNVRRPEWHIVESEHRAKVMIPIMDQNAIRQLDEIWSHCVLCNDMTKNVDFHLQSLLHKNKVKHCLIELGNNTDSDEEKIQPVKFKENPKITALSLKNHLALTSKNYLNCIICNVIVNYSLKAVQQHIISFEHLNNFEEECTENQLVDLNDDNFYCVPCVVNLTRLDVITHCKGKRHAKLLQEKLNTTDLDSNEIALTSISQNVKHSKSQIVSELICFVCNIVVFCVDEHMDSFSHKKSYCSYLELNKLNEIEADTYFCIPCNTVITIDYLMGHCTSRKHKLALKNVFGIETKPFSTEAKPFNTGTNALSTERPSTSQNNKDKIMPLKVLYQFKEMTDPAKLLCTVCDEEIYYSKKQAEYHVTSLDHVVAFNLMMLWNKIKKRDDKYFCDICRSDMTYFSEITHVSSALHVANLAKEAKGTVYEYDRALVTHAYALSHKAGNRSRLSSVAVAKSDCE